MVIAKTKRPFQTEVSCKPFQAINLKFLNDILRRSTNVSLRKPHNSLRKVSHTFSKICNINTYINL